MSSLSRIGARLLRASVLVDRAYRTFDRARSWIVTAFASDALLAEYNALAYGATPVYDAGAAEFREALFTWEVDLVGRMFPRPPARVLVGGAGGGREALQLAEMGYDVTAFEPSRQLADSMRERAARTGATVRAMLGRYEDLPILRTLDAGAPYDLAAAPRFDAAMLGWSSLSHIRGGGSRSAALRAVADLTDGPVVASFFPRPSRSAGRAGSLRRRLARAGRRDEGDAFTMHVGYYHVSSREELEDEVHAAGLRLLAASYEESDGRWPWIAVARPQIAERLSERAAGAGSNATD